ncbi:hypothetical protein P153DRAFT_385429 [Dothidotthia symphoricarpi CBS 119687]|uniref:Uncharacterized protein n=1 Tax=Dothidotthia symphoricarpi CBS 119687 TaxID=1392245 RepID=A0A6A6ABL3_9PLEO|nr:uncharacterized protein P153DRAFT_385429 [Dothidotthia symphoricarpi CBS 119687]KAF2129210.1 hypothetical protein P153DRAFT_385429 [Dothidotthia symphoricarpi CBS 119687]
MKLFGFLLAVFGLSTIAFANDGKKKKLCEDDKTMCVNRIDLHPMKGVHYTAITICKNEQWIPLLDCDAPTEYCKDASKPFCRKSQVNIKCYPCNKYYQRCIEDCLFFDDKCKNFCTAYVCHHGGERCGGDCYYGC